MAFVSRSKHAIGRTSSNKSHDDMLSVVCAVEYRVRAGRPAARNVRRCAINRDLCVLSLLSVCEHCEGTVQTFNCLDEWCFLS